MRRFATAVTITALVAVIGIGDGTNFDAAAVDSVGTPDTRGQITAADLPLLQLVDYSPRPYDDKYGAALQASCTEAAALTASTDGAAAGGLGSAIGDRDGRTVIRTQTIRTTTVNAAKKLVAPLNSPECAAILGGDVLTGVTIQYPSLPTLTYGAPVHTGNVISMPFTGTSTIGTLAGMLHVANTANTIGIAALRVANPLPGQVDALSAAIVPTLRYETAVASTPAPSAKLLAQQTGLVADLDRLVTQRLQLDGIADATVADLARHGAPSYPPPCGTLFDAYTFSGKYAAIDGRTFQGAGGKIRAQLESFAFPTPTQARQYGNYFKDIDACLEEMWTTPAGTELTGIVRTPKSGLARGGPGCQVRYIGTWTVPGSITPALTRAVGVGTSKNRAYSVSAQYEQGNLDKMAVGTCKAVAAASK